MGAGGRNGGGKGRDEEGPRAAPPATGRPRPTAAPPDAPCPHPPGASSCQPAVRDGWTPRPGRWLPVPTIGHSCQPTRWPYVSAAASGGRGWLEGVVATPQAERRAATEVVGRVANHDTTEKAVSFVYPFVPGRLQRRGCPCRARPLGRAAWRPNWHRPSGAPSGLGGCDVTLRQEAGAALYLYARQGRRRGG